jgi:hypothetical protein
MFTAGPIIFKCAVIEVSDLLRSLILALIREPVLYDEHGKGGLIARLIAVLW